MLSTTAGDLELRIPKLGTGSFFPGLLEHTTYLYVFLDAASCKARVNHRVISQAISAVRIGSAWQRCRVHFMRNVPAVVREAKDDLLAFTGFPQVHWRQIWSTNPLERMNKAIMRRADVVGVVPNPQALPRLAGAVLVEQHDEWAATDRRSFSQSSMSLVTTPTTQTQGQVRTPEPMTA